MQIMRYLQWACKHPLQTPLHLRQAFQMPVVNNEVFALDTNIFAATAIKPAAESYAQLHMLYLYMSNWSNATSNFFTSDGRENNNNE